MGERPKAVMVRLLKEGSQTGGSKRSMRTGCGRDVGRFQIVQRTLRMENEVNQVTGQWANGTRQESEPNVRRWFRQRKVDIPCLEVARNRSLGGAILSKANGLMGRVYQGLWETAVLICQF